MREGFPKWVVPALLVVGSGLGALVLAAPGEYLGVIEMGLYSVPSHVFVSPFPHEPVLLFFSKTHDAWALALASTWGSLVAALVDFWLVLPWLHRPGVRSKYVDLTIYKRSDHWFGKAPFWALVVTGLTPIPFYPFKFLALAADYPLSRYLLALAVGRTPRYWCLAYLGYVLQPPDWVLILLAVVIVGLALRGVLAQRIRVRRRASAPKAFQGGFGGGPSEALRGSSASEAVRNP